MLYCTLFLFLRDEMQTPSLVYKNLALALFFAVLFPIALHAQEVDHWETIIETGQSVKYLVPSSPVPSEWVNTGFDDTGWTDGIAGIGYGDEDDSTDVGACISVYWRCRFTVSDPGVIEKLILDMDFDDSFVAYLNGEELARVNLGAANSATTYDQLSDGLSEARLHDGLQPFRFVLDETITDLLTAGENIFCVEVHNQSSGSSDLSSNAFLHAGINTSSTYFSSVPDWFYAPASYDSYLPIMTINTNGQTIPNDPRIVADMGIIHHGNDEENSTDDPPNVYDGKISIEIRGSSSQSFDKKSYSIELQTDTGTNNNVYILGFPRENDFVLNGPYSDKTLIRNVISYKVFEEMGRWAPRTRFIELYINDDYRGIYVLTEKVKVDRWRVNVNQLDAEDISPEQISGGYILQIDRTNSLASNEYWTSPVTPPYSQYPRNTFEYYDPKIDELTSAQASYVRNYVNDMDAVLASNNYKDPVSGYRPLLDVSSFVDYLILHEFNKDVDAYRLSTFFYKADISRGGKLHAGPPWDYNLTFGNMYYGGDTKETYNWMYPYDAGRYWWPHLMKDPFFEDRVFCRWDGLKKTILNEEWMTALIDSCVNVMGASVDRNFERWPVLGVYVWPNDFIGLTYESEVYFLKNWISERLEWLDNQWSGQCQGTGLEEELILALDAIRISPNPSKLIYTTIHLPNEDPGEYLIALYDMNGRTVHTKPYTLGQSTSEIMLDDLSYLETGIYLLRITGPGNMFYTGKLVKN